MLDLSTLFYTTNGNTHAFLDRQELTPSRVSSSYDVFFAKLKNFNV